MTNEQIFNNAVKYADIEAVKEDLQSYEAGLISLEEAIEKILLDLAVIDKPIIQEVAEYEQKAQEIVNNQINKLIK